MLFCQFSWMPIGHFSSSCTTIMHKSTHALMRGIANESMRKLKPNSISFNRATGSANDMVWFRVITVLMTSIKKYRRSVLKVNYQVTKHPLQDLSYFVLNENIWKWMLLQAVFLSVQSEFNLVNDNILILNKQHPILRLWKYRTKTGHVRPEWRWTSGPNHTVSVSNS